MLKIMWDFICYSVIGFKDNPKNTNDIQRLSEFIEATSQKQCSTKEEMNCLFHDSKALVLEYVYYYNEKREKARRRSNIYRILIAIFGFIGLTLPILGTLVSNKEYNLAEIGYSFIIFTAVIVALKSFFGYTKAHIRYTKIQLKLEKIIIKYTIEWKQAISISYEKFTYDNKRALFRVLTQYLDESFDAICSETNTWSENIIEDEQNFIKQEAKKPQK